VGLTELRFRIGDFGLRIWQRGLAIADWGSGAWDGHSGVRTPLERNGDGRNEGSLRISRPRSTISNLKSEIRDGHLMKGQARGRWEGRDELRAPAHAHPVLAAGRCEQDRCADQEGEGRQHAGGGDHRPRQHVRRRSSSNRKASAEGIKPILGCEVYVAPRSRKDRGGRADDFEAGGNHHLILSSPMPRGIGICAAW